MFSDSLKKLWGFHPMQDAYFHALREENPSLVPARITFTSHDQYKTLVLASKEERSAKVRGHFYHGGSELPVVGDWVAIEWSSGDHQSLPIEAVLPRFSELRRVDNRRGYQTLVANVDFIGLVTSFNQDLNERRLERGLAMIEESRAKPIIIINKNDLIDEPSANQQLQVLSDRFKNVMIVSCSAQSKNGIDRVTALLGDGQSVAFLGMSGVGKSSLINVILDEDHLQTKEIRLEDSRGRHTTTHRELLLTKHGFWIIDNPGIREFSFGGEEDSLNRTFEDVSLLMLSCRFSDCAHDGEPGCKISEALETGELSTDRWENYLKIIREMDFQANKGNKAYHSQKRKVWAKRSMDLRQRLKTKERR